MKRSSRSHSLNNAGQPMQQTTCLKIQTSTCPLLFFAACFLVDFISSKGPLCWFQSLPIHKTSAGVSWFYCNFPYCPSREISPCTTCRGFVHITFSLWRNLRNKSVCLLQKQTLRLLFDKKKYCCLSKFRTGKSFFSSSQAPDDNVGLRYKIEWALQSIWKCRLHHTISKYWMLAPKSVANLHKTVQWES